ncbi:MAG: hypothetical protein AAGA48_37885 [Myxococcota bacterium]
MTTILPILGGALFALLGGAHLWLTLTSRPDRGGFTPKDAEVRAAMARPGGLGLAPDLQIPLWQPWIGFNVSHSLGALLLGAVIAVPPLWWGTAALQHPLWLIPSLLLPPIYLLTSMRYWFSAPTRGIGLATVLVWSGAALAWWG